MTKEEIGKTLRELRLATGKTQKEVAQIIGRNQQMVGHWETGYSQPDADTLFTLCDIYDVSVSEAFGLTPKKSGLSKEEQKIIDNYRSLNRDGKKKLIDYAEDLVGTGRYKDLKINSDMETAQELTALSEENGE